MPTLSSLVLPYAVIMTTPRTSSAWWRLRIETLSALLGLSVRAFYAGNGFPSQGPSNAALKFFSSFFMLAKANGWISRRMTGALRRQEAQMTSMSCATKLLWRQWNGISIFREICKIIRLSLLVSGVITYTWLWDSLWPKVQSEADTAKCIMLVLNIPKICAVIMIHFALTISYSMTKI